MATRARRSDAGSSAAEGPKHNHIFRDFGGINTQAARQAIKPEEFAWIENVMPIGHGNARIVPARSAAIATIASGNCYYMLGYNLNDSDYEAMATDSGSLYQVLLDTPYTVTTIGSGFSTSGVAVAQWSNTYLLIVDPINGYFVWDGTTLTPPGGVVAVDVTLGGSYPVVPLISFTGGGGVGASAYASMSLTGAQTITAAGASYVAGDIITLVGGTYTAPGKLHVDTVDGSGHITAVSIFDSGLYTVLPAAPVATTGGGNNAATITPAYAVTSITVTNSGTVAYSNAPAVAFDSGSATATATILSGPPKGEYIATYSGRAWVSYGRTLAYSAPGSYYDFIGTGSGITTITDSTLNDKITQLITANNFLYFTGSNSLNIIGDVSTNSTGDTIFSNTNISASVGTKEPFSVIPYYRAIWMANRSGTYSISGATPMKVSDALDGVFQNIDFSLPISAGQMYLYNNLCAAFLFSYEDSMAGITRPLIAIFFNKKWFIANQGSDLVFISGGVNPETQALYGTDGKSLYVLFDDETTPVSWVIKSAFWDAGDVTRDKQITKFGFECTVPQSIGTISLSLDALSSTPPFTSADAYQVAVDSSVVWTNAIDEEVTWVNTSLEVVGWSGSGYFMDMEDGTTFGKYVGITMSSSDVIGSINSEMLEYTFRVRW